MKSRKMKSSIPLLLCALAAGLLVAPFGAAMASCGDGYLIDESFDGSLRITSDDFNCVIIGSSIAGDLIVTNVNNVLLLNNKVGGKIRVDGNAKNGTANVVGNTIHGGSLVVREMETANVVDNETLAGSIRVIENIKAVVRENIASDNLWCNNNTALVALFNNAGQESSCK